MIYKIILKSHAEQFVESPTTPSWSFDSTCQKALLELGPYDKRAQFDAKEVVAVVPVEEVKP